MLFQTLHCEPEGQARCGEIETAHGTVSTPAFMPVGTAATVKAMPRESLLELGAGLILANTYHLYLRPGADIICSLGGLHRFMAWPGAMLTDSGGFQVFSHRDLRSINEEGVEFRSHLDGSRHFLTPEKAVRIQQDLGADIIMAFDDCTPYPVSQSEARESMLRSMRWAGRCKQAHQRSGQALFGIVQGSVFTALRQESLDHLLSLDLDGTALGGFSVGEPRGLMYDLVAEFGPRLPQDKPRYLMGVGTPVDLIHCVRQGIDLFDCVLPTRNARNGTLFTWQGKLRIKNSRYRSDDSALDPDCRCRVCRLYSRAYLRHLFVSGEILSSLLNTYHNIAFYMDLMKRIRQCIVQGGLAELQARLEERYMDGT